MREEIILTICERYRENRETVRITGHTEDGEEYTFRVLGENAWWFESFLKEGTQIILCPTETYVVYTVMREKRIRIPPENTLHIQSEAKQVREDLVKEVS